MKIRSVQALLFLFGVTLMVAATVAAPVRGQEVEVEAGETQVEVTAEESDRDLARPTAGRGERLNVTNRAIARWLLVDQKQLIDLAEYGKQRTKTPAIRELAETIIQDHQAFSEELREVARGDREGQRREAPRDRRERDELREERPRRRDRNDGDRERIRGGDRTVEQVLERMEESVEIVQQRAEEIAEGARDTLKSTREALGRRLAEGDTRRGMGSPPWVEVHQQIARNTAELVRHDLEELAGNKFDDAFLGMMAAAHVQQEATVEVLAKHARGDFEARLDKAQTTIRRHRKRAEKIMGAKVEDY